MDTAIVFNPKAPRNSGLFRKIFGDDSEVLNEDLGQDRGLLTGLEHAVHCKVQSLSSAHRQYCTADSNPAVLSALKLMSIAVA